MNTIKALTTTTSLVAALALSPAATANCGLEHAGASCVPMALTADLPSNSSVGACFARIHEPARFETVTEQVLVTPATERVEVTPARYETINERVLVKAASSRVEALPATYQWIDEQVLVEPARTEWRSSACTAAGAIANATGECACLVTTPARYETLRKQALLTPATTRTIAIPAEYETVQRTVVASPAHEVRVAVPAEYRTVTRQVQVSGERFGWAQLACSSGEVCSIDGAGTLRLEDRLRDAGYLTGPIDGLFDAQTREALSSYQRDHGLVDGSCQGVAYLQRRY